MKNGDKEILSGLIKLVNAKGIDNWSRETAIDLLRSYEKWQKFASDKQSEFARNLPKSAYEKLDRKNRESEKLDNIPAADKLRDKDRKVVSGKVVSLKWKDTRFGWYATQQLKVLLDVGHGRKLWASADTQMEVGQEWSAKVTIKATDDPTFFIGSRPAGWEPFTKN